VNTEQKNYTTNPTLCAIGAKLTVLTDEVLVSGFFRFV